MVLVGAGTIYWLHTRNFETTDDAFIDAHVTQMAPQVAGRVIALNFADNEHVTAGRTLVLIDRTTTKQGSIRRGRKRAMRWPGCNRPRPSSLLSKRVSISLALAERTGYQFCDELIVAAALEARCDTLFSEDLHDGQVIDGQLIIHNPFRPDA